MATRTYRIGPLSLELTLPDGALESELDQAWGAFRGVPPGQATKLAPRGLTERADVEAAVKAILAQELSVNGGFLLNAVAVAHGGGSAVFVAPKGGGKSTLGQMAARGGLSVLADALVAVFPISGEWWAYGTPWNAGAAWGAPLKTLGTLRFGAAPLVEKLSSAELAKALVENAALAAGAPLEKAAEAAASRVKTVRLVFDPHPRVAELLTPLCQ